jgi:soluble lytic murein transglycosylase
LCLIFCCAAPQARPFDEALFIEAEVELKTGVGPRYEALRAELDDYPLAIYLDYQALGRQLHSLEPDVAQSYLHHAQGSPLHNRFLAAYIESKGRHRQWRDLLAVQQTPPRSAELQCYWYRAQWGTGNKTLAYAGAA